MRDSNKPSDITKKLISYEIKKNYIEFLVLLEELKENYSISDEDFSDIRKKVLDVGNDTRRKVNSHLERVKINFH